MTANHFVSSLRIIQRSEHDDRWFALIRYGYWQIRKLLFPRPVYLQLSQSTITDDEPGGVISLVNMLGLYDYNNMRFVQMVLQRTPVFIDVGANIGAYTLIASEIPAAIVVSLEPVPAAFAKLQRNIVLNRRENVQALNVGASREPGTLTMTCKGASPVNRVVAPGAGSTDTIVVRMDTMDAICQRLTLVPSLIKIDVEGHEPEVLAGASQCLSACQACIVENGDRPSIISLMREHGMIGPLYYRHSTATLQHAPQSLAEDQIYIGRSFAENFPAVVLEKQPDCAGRP